MNYDNGIKILPAFDNLKDKDLNKSPQWRIIHLALLPIEAETLLAYSLPLDWLANGHWLANGVNHDALYNSTGLYYKQDGTNIPDDLTFYALLKNRKEPLHVEYKCELIVNLINSGEISAGDIPSFALPYLSDRSV